jgi:cytochrome c oxidase assembly protein subunit 11
MDQDVDAKDVHDITLSYTFFQSRQPEGAPDLSRFENAPPDPGAGRTLFATTCSACHTPEQNKVGPLLGGVVGRRAGSVPGYPYSAALARSGVTWNAATLDKWLAGPQHFIPGAEMPFSLPDAISRRDVIAYLATLPAPAVPPAPTSAPVSAPAGRAAGQTAVPVSAHPG